MKPKGAEGISPRPICLKGGKIRMTIREAINRADRLRPKMHEMKDKMAWLTNVERLVADFMNRHEDVQVELPVYTEASDMDTQLLLQHEDAEIYVTWLMM